MKHQLNRTLSLLLAVLLCVGLFAGGIGTVSALEGTCGEGLTWTLENGVLTVSGSGSMDNYSEFSPAPWQDSADLIQRVTVGEGVSNVGNMAFYHCANLTTVTLAGSVKTLGELAFAGCTSLRQIGLGSVEVISRGCFYDCLELANVILPETLKTLGDEAFYRCKGLGGITIPASVTEFGSSVFAHCESLVYVRVLAQIDVLPYYTFFGCEQLSQLYLPDTIESVERNAVAECPELHYVDCGGSAEAKEELQRQMNQDTTTVVGTGSNTSVGYTQSDGAVITTTTTTQEGANDWSGETEYGTEIKATVTDPSGWEDVADSVSDTISSGENPTVEVEVDSGTEMPAGALDGIADQDVTVTIHTSDNADWQVILGDQTEDSLSGSQNFAVELSKNEAGSHADTIGDAPSYTVKLGQTTLNSTVLLPLGSEAARQIATLYIVDGGSLTKLSSVIVDDDGKAAFCLAGTSEGEYIIALNVQDIPQEEVMIPQKLSQDYDITYGATLTDAYGNQYVLTGRVNKLGFGLETLTWIIVGVLGGSVVLVGVVMVIWNKSRKNAYKVRNNRANNANNTGEK